MEDTAPVRTVRQRGAGNYVCLLHAAGVAPRLVSGDSRSGCQRFPSDSNKRMLFLICIFQQNIYFFRFYGKFSNMPANKTKKIMKFQFPQVRFPMQTAYAPLTFIHFL
ncbi:MAG: hypothetical protein HFG44_08965 [Oscillospiraceae bacterium]|nr:hypothetical protein [Oscillospiraceae bacterium]